MRYITAWPQNHLTVLLRVIPVGCLWLGIRFSPPSGYTIVSRLFGTSLHQHRTMIHSPHRHLSFQAPNPQRPRSIAAYCSTLTFLMLTTKYLAQSILWKSAALYAGQMIMTANMLGVPLLYVMGCLDFEQQVSKVREQTPRSLRHEARAPFTQLTRRVPKKKPYTPGSARSQTISGVGPFVSLHVFLFFPARHVKGPSRRTFTALPALVETGDSLEPWVTCVKAKADIYTTNTNMQKQIHTYQQITKLHQVVGAHPVTTEFCTGPDSAPCTP